MQVPRAYKYLAYINRYTGNDFDATTVQRHLSSAQSDGAAPPRRAASEGVSPSVLVLKIHGARLGAPLF